MVNSCILDNTHTIQKLAHAGKSNMAQPLFRELGGKGCLLLCKPIHDLD